MNSALPQPPNAFNSQIRNRISEATIHTLSARGGRTAFFHVTGLGLAFLSSSIWQTDQWICWLLLLIVVVSSFLSTLLSKPYYIKKFNPEQWILRFGVAKLGVLFVWSIWLCLNIRLTGLSQSTYLASLIISGVCTAGILTLSSKRWLVISGILIMLVPPALCFALVGTQDAYLLAAIFGMMSLFLVSMVNRIHLDYAQTQINRELAVQNGKTVEGILNSIPGFVSCVDHQLNYVWSNQRLNEVFGVNLSKHVKSLGALQKEDAFPKRILQFINSRKKDDQFEFEMNLSGEMRWMMVFLSAFSEFGEGRVLIVAYDIHASKLAEMELVRQRAVLVESSKLATLGEMSAGIAHEVNNPLAVMLGRAELMLSALRKGPVETPVLIENFEKIVKSIERIAKIIRGLKSFSRNGENDPLEEVLIEKMINEVLEFSRERFKMKNISIRLKLEEGLTIQCRSTQIEQVFLNLLSNSFDAISGSEKPWIEITAQTIGGRVVISFMDSGNGIPAAVVEKIMQPFFTTKEVGKGTGLGLSISLGIIHSHRGEFYYDADSPHTRFVMNLPRKQGSTDQKVM